MIPGPQEQTSDLVKLYSSVRKQVVEKQIRRYASRSNQLRRELEESRRKEEQLAVKIGIAKEQLRQLEMTNKSTPTRIINILVEDMKASLYRASFQQEYVEEEKIVIANQLQELTEKAAQLRFDRDNYDVPAVDDLEWQLAVEQTHTVVDMPPNLRSSASTLATIFSEVKGLKTKLKANLAKIANLERMGLHGGSASIEEPAVVEKPKAFELSVLPPRTGRGSMCNDGTSTDTRPSKDDVVANPVRRKKQRVTFQDEVIIKDDLVSKKDYLNEVKKIQLELLGKLEERAFVEKLSSRRISSCNHDCKADHEQDSTADIAPEAG
jgi:hypothetical protein